MRSRAAFPWLLRERQSGPAKAKGRATNGVGWGGHELPQNQAAPEAKTSKVLL